MQHIEGFSITTKKLNEMQWRTDVAISRTK